ncbi:MAG: tyrosine-type recombinase/integrase [Anaerolineales bacterium]
MSQRTLASTVSIGLQVSPLDTAYQDFVLSRQAMPCTDATMQHYRFTAGVFVTWLQLQGVTDPKDVTAGHVRQWQAENADRLKDTSQHARARGVRTFLRFLHTEGTLPTLVKVQMPRLEKRRLPCLEADEVHRLLRDCDARKTAIIRLLADSGVRAAELCNLNWGDLNMQTGLLFVRRGKGRKDRTTVVGPKTRRTLLRYRSTLKPAPTAESPLIQGRGGRRLAPCWLSHLVRKWGKRKGLYVTPHALRRTFAVQSLRGGMDLLSLQRLMGHADLSMTSHYVQLLDEDLIRAHEKANLDSWL